MHIEDDTADWLGIPTPLETCKQHILLLEDEIAELIRQLRESRRNIYKLVEMHSQATKERDALAETVRKSEQQISDLNHQNTDLKNTVNSLHVVRRQCEDLRQRVFELEAKGFKGPS